MCGIAGFTTFKKYQSEKDMSLQTLENMCERLQKRGPDSKGCYIKNDFALCHRRLSIIDVATGSQPMTSLCGNYTIVYNGELYNTMELRKDLERKGKTFKTTSDTEVILNAFIEYREKAPEFLNGIFAFAICDLKNNNIFLCRDRFGVKPLFYTIVDNNIVFGSEIKALFAHPRVSPKIDDNSLREIFGTFPSRTERNGIYKNVYELGFGEFAYFSEKGFFPQKYYELTPKENHYSYKESKEKTKELVTDSVLRQMVSDVSISTFLSGGVDSSIVTAIASNELKKRNKTLSTISFDYKDNSLFFQSNAFQVDEDKHWVKKMVDIFNTDHTYLFLDTKDLISSLEDSVIAKDYPGMADIDSSLLGFCKDVKKDHTVVLSGECADEIFGGYPWFSDETAFKTPAFPWIRNMDFRESMLNDATKNRLDISSYVQNRYDESISAVPKLYGEDPIEARRREITYLNIKWFMTTLLERMDRMSMYNGLEVRVPYADHRLIDFLYNVPWEYKNRLGAKGLLRDAFSDTLPKDLLFRKKSPYPKTYNPAYEKELGKILKAILEDKSSPINEFVNKENLLALIDSPKDYGKPWFGQLMAGPQLLAYYIQVNYWLKTYL